MPFSPPNTNAILNTFVERYRHIMHSERSSYYRQYDQALAEAASRPGSTILHALIDPDHYYVVYDPGDALFLIRNSGYEEARNDQQETS